MSDSRMMSVQQAAIVVEDYGAMMDDDMSKNNQRRGSNGNNNRSRRGFKMTRRQSTGQQEEQTAKKSGFLGFRRSASQSDMTKLRKNNDDDVVVASSERRASDSSSDAGTTLHSNQKKKSGRRFSLRRGAKEELQSNNNNQAEPPFAYDARQDYQSSGIPDDGRRVEASPEAASGRKGFSFRRGSGTSRNSPTSKATDEDFNKTPFAYPSDDVLQAEEKMLGLNIQKEKPVVSQATAAAPPQEGTTKKRRSFIGGFRTKSNSSGNLESLRDENKELFEYPDEDDIEEKNLSFEDMQKEVVTPGGTTRRRRSFMGGIRSKNNSKGEVASSSGSVDESREPFVYEDALSTNEKGWDKNASFEDMQTEVGPGGTTRRRRSFVGGFLGKNKPAQQTADQPIVPNVEKQVLSQYPAVDNAAGAKQAGYQQMPKGPVVLPDGIMKPTTTDAAPTPAPTPSSSRSRMVFRRLSSPRTSADSFARNDSAGSSQEMAVPAYPSVAANHHHHQQPQEFAASLLV